MTEDNSNQIPREKADIQYEIVKKLQITPIISTVLKQVGISRATFYRWIRDSENFKGLVAAARDMSVLTINDMCEAQLIALVKEKNLPAIKYWLDNHHEDYVRVHNRAFPGLPQDVLTLDKDTFLFEELSEELLQALRESSERPKESDENEKTN